MLRISCRRTRFSSALISPATSTIPLPPAAPAQDGLGDSSPGSWTPTSPALSTASTADDEDDDLGSSPAIPLLPAPKLSERASAILRAPAFDIHDFQIEDDEQDDSDNNLASDDEQFGTASWGSPYLRSDVNLRRQSYESEGSESDESESFPIHSLDINTPFLRPPPVILSGRPQTPAQSLLPTSAAAAVLVHRARRRNRGLTEGWIRTHTAGPDQNTEARLWFSDGDSSEHSSLSGSEADWYQSRDPRTPRPSSRYRAKSRSTSRHPRAISSVETLKAGDHLQSEADDDMASSVATETGSVVGLNNHNDLAMSSIPPIKVSDKALPREQPFTPRIKKKVPWKGKNIMIMLPRDEERGQPGRPPFPLRQHEIERMFDSWTELGYNVDGFDLPAEDDTTGESQSREAWPSFEDLDQERYERDFTVVLPDLNAWKNYVNELQEAKLRALGVSFGGDEPEAAPSISSQPSRLPSAQYPPLPFSPPIPTSSASSNHAIPGFPFPSPFIPGAAQSPLASGASPVPFSVAGKFNARQSISFPANSSPFQQPPQGWPNQAGILQGMSPLDSPSMANFNGIMSPQSPYGVDYHQTGSPAFNLHQRHQSLQYLPQQYARASPRLQDVREDEEEEEPVGGKSPSKTPEPAQRNADQLQAEIDDAEYHLEEQLRNELEHEDYNPQTRAEAVAHQPFAAAHAHQPSAGGFAPVEHFANEPGKPLVLHHPRPHSRGHSLTQNFYRDNDPSEGVVNQGVMPQFGPLNDIPETQRVDEAYEEIQTNPSNLGTPIQDIDFAAAFSKHQKNVSASSNPWQDAVSLNNAGSQHSANDSKSSLSKFNVEAPEFKFNPTSTFTPGLFNFDTPSFQPGVYHAGAPDAMEQTPFGAPPQQPLAAKINVNAPTFAPGQSEFNFSSSGPKFRPDAPAFTPFQPQGAASNAAEVGTKGFPRRTDSIFTNIRIEPSQHAESVAPKKSRAVPILRPSSESPVASEGDIREPDGRIEDDSRAKRAKSAAADSDDVPLFANRPDDLVEEEEEEGDDIGMAESSVKESRSIAEEGSVDGEAVLPADTSMSSVDQIDTQVTTAAPSETSPAEASMKWTSSFEMTPRHLSAATPASLPELADETEARSDGEGLSESTQPNAQSAPEDPQLAIARRKLTPKGLAGSRFALPLPRTAGLASSRFAEPTPAATAEQDDDDDDTIEFAEEGKSSFNATPTTNGDRREPTFEEIDAVMQRMERDHSQGINKSIETFKWPRPAVEAHASSDELHIPSDHAREKMSVIPRKYSDVPDNTSQPMLSTELEDPFVDPPLSAQILRRGSGFEEAELESDQVSDWEGAFSEEEHSKLENRAQFFDGRVNDVVGTLLAARLEPLEKALLTLSHSVKSKGQRAPSSRRDARGNSTEYQDSDADDEDDEPLPRRSTSPKRDRRLDQIRSIVVEALASQSRSNLPIVNTDAPNDGTLLRSLDEIKELLVTSARHTPRDDINSAPFEGMLQAKSDDELAAKVRELEQRHRLDQERLENEINERRAAEEAVAELNRKLQASEALVEVEVINRSVFDGRVAELEARVRRQEDTNEQEVKARRAAEDNMSEAQRLLRNASEEETRLREVVEERNQAIKSLEHSAGKTALQISKMEVARDHWTHHQAEMVNRINVLETDLRNVRQDNNTWRAETERADEAARRSNGELGHALNENKHLHKSLDSVVSQLEENERLREKWRSKFLSLQNDMGQAAREVAEESARRIKKEQAMLARQEVLEARLQAESKTRERLEVEMDRLQDNERTGLRAVNECNRLEGLLSELRSENFKLQQAAARYQREFEEARESGASEVKRTRMSLQAELEDANNQVNVVREEYEEQNAKLRAELDHLRLQIDTAKAQNEMLLEEAQTTRIAELGELKQKHQNELEDVQARYERQLNNVTEDGQRTEQHLLERLSLSTSKTELLQDRVIHLEEKLEITKQAAAAAAQAAKSAGVDSSVLSPVMAKPVERVEMPEKISPQALRESIMVLQEQLQAREQHIEDLEQTVADLDPDAPAKISKRDDEIIWLRELLAVRQGDLQDIITALSRDRFDRAAVKDAAIRLKANLQMEEQERERAMNGGSAITLPNIAQTIQAATPRVAQTIAPIAAAWDSWRKSGQTGFRGISGVLSSPAVTGNSTPTKSRSDSTQQNGGMVSGLLTPPATALRQSPTPDNNGNLQPTAFSSIGRRFTGQSVHDRTRTNSNVSHRSDKKPFQDLALRRQELAAEPVTPPHLGHQSVYDEDAQPGDFDDHDFFEED